MKKFAVLGTILGIVVGTLVFAGPARDKERESALIASGLSPSVTPILSQSCADCHSNLSHRPWYGNIPLVSKLIDDDILRGRQFLDLTRWSGYTRGRKLGYLASIRHSIGAGHMPPARYWLAHPYAYLSQQESDSVRAWATQEIRGLRSLGAIR